MDPGDVISYAEMCAAEDANLQRGMNFRIGPDHSVILMSQRQNAPYEDTFQGDGILIYQGHNCPLGPDTPDPTQVDQPRWNKSGTLTQNGLFEQAANRHKLYGFDPEPVRAYEKLRDGEWLFRGVFQLVDAWQEQSEDRRVFKFQLSPA